MTAVGPEGAVVEPPAFVAVSCTSSLCPTSPAVGTYSWPVAPSATQFLPSASHCSHWSLKLVGSYFHLPGTSVRVLPCWAVPVIVGEVSITGAGGSTTAVGAEGALVEPPALVAVSCTARLSRTAPAVGRYSWPMAPVIAVQLLPSPSHCSHWSLKL